MAVQSADTNRTRHRGDVLLDIRGLSVSFLTAGGSVAVTRDVSFSIAPGERLGVVGESGCGKTVTGLSLLGLLPARTSRVTGEILFEGRDLNRMTPDQMRAIRGREIGMIFQEPMTALDPVFTIGEQIGEARTGRSNDPCRVHERCRSPSARLRRPSLAEQPRRQFAHASEPEHASEPQSPRSCRPGGARCVFGFEVHERKAGGYGARRLLH